jgi:hypothetical protein
MRFSQLNPLGRAIIVAVAVLTGGVAAVAFATSYGALYAFIRDAGLYSDRLSRAWPLLLDGAFIVAQLAAILAGMLRASRGWPFLMMLVTGALTVWFNLQHAGADPGRRLAAAIPPVLMILAFEIDLAIVKWVMRALGRPLETAGPLPHPGVFPALVDQQDRPATWGGSELGRDGHGSKRAVVDAYLDRIGPRAAVALGPRGVAQDLAEQGAEVSERYVRELIDARQSEGPAGGNGHRPGGSPG